MRKGSAKPSEPRKRRARRNSRDQARSSMLAVGRTLLHERDIDQVSVKEIAEASGSSVGSFYNCFGDKDTYFTWLIEDMVRRRREGAKANFQEPFEKLPRALASGAIHNYREHQGMIRSALRRHVAGAPIWKPITNMSSEFVDEYRRRCAHHIGRPLTHHESRRIAFAFVWLYGMLMQQVINLTNIHEYDLSEADFLEDATRSFISLLKDAVTDGLPE